MPKVKPTRSTVSITLTLSPLAHGVLTALARLSAGGAEPRAGVVVEEAIREMAERRSPGMWRTVELRAFALRASGQLRSEEIADGVADAAMLAFAAFADLAGAVKGGAS